MSTIYYVGEAISACKPGHVVFNYSVDFFNNVVCLLVEYLVMREENMLVVFKEHEGEVSESMALDDREIPRSFMQANTVGRVSRGGVNRVLRALNKPNLRISPGSARICPVSLIREEVAIPLSRNYILRSDV